MCSPIAQKKLTGDYYETDFTGIIMFICNNCGFCPSGCIRQCCNRLTIDDGILGSYDSFH